MAGPSDWPHAAVSRRAASTSHRPLLFRVYRDSMQLAQLTGARATADKVAEAAFQLAETSIERADLHNVRIVACSMRGAYPVIVSVRARKSR